MLEVVDLLLVKKVGKNAFRVLSNLKEIKMREVEELENFEKVEEKKGFSNSKIGYFMNKELRKNLISF